MVPYWDEDACREFMKNHKRMEPWFVGAWAVMVIAAIFFGVFVAIYG